jgi:hypothetical protein
VTRPISDDELAAEALAADPDAPLPDDAIPLVDPSAPALVGAWYMPAPRSRLLHGWRRRVALLIVATFLVIEVYGLCSTYGGR